MVNIVYVLDHTYENEYGDEQSKPCGIYKTNHEAEAAIFRLRSKEGFDKHPEGFSVVEYEINRDYWQDGFISKAKAMQTKYP